MINLLPPAIKTEITFSKRNAVLLHYTVLTGAVMTILAGSLMGARFYLNSQIEQVTLDNKQKEASIAGKKELEEKAKVLSARVNSIQTIQKSQAKYSLILDDLASSMPDGSAITSITLTGDDKAPVKMIASARDYNTAVSIRDGISKSARISAVDLVAIQGPDAATSGGLYRVDLTFSFNPGQAK